ncbi:MAG: MFS transporter [Candidatus Omnitrophota bacterium]
MVSNSSNKVRGKIRTSLRYSFYDGVFASSMTGFTQEFFAPLILVLRGTAAHIGMLSALPNLIGSLIQAASAMLSERFKSRKTVACTFVLIQAFTLIPIAVMALAGTVSPMAVIFFVVLFVSAGAVATPAWASMMSDLVPSAKRGAYFGWRNRILGFIMVGASFTAGIILNIMKGVNVFAGFFVIFGLAFLLRAASWKFLTKMYEPPLKFGSEHRFTFLEFIKRTRKSNFAQFVLFVAAMNFCVNMASPYFSVLMLRDLHFSYFLYTTITISAPLTVYFMIRRWGLHADHAGNLKVIQHTAPFIGLIPVFWILNRSPLVLFAAQIFSGFVWAGFNLATSNFIYDAVSPEKRVRCICYFNVINGTALCGGALLGGALLRYLPPIMGYNILTLMAVSAVLRTLVGIFLPRWLKEVRSVSKVNHTDLFFSVIGVRPLIGIERKTIRY